MSAPPVVATPYDPLLTYQFRVQLLDPPADATPDELASTRGTLGSGSSSRSPDIGSAGTGYVAGVRRVSGAAACSGM